MFPFPNRWRNNIIGSQHPHLLGYEALTTGCECDWPPHLCYFLYTADPIIIITLVSLITGLNLSPLDWNTLKARMVTYSSSNSQNQSWWLAHHKHSRNISWVSNEWTNELWGLFLLSLPSLPGSEKIRKHSRCYCQPHEKVCSFLCVLWDFWGPPAYQAPSLLSCIALRFGALPQPCVL